MNPVASCGGTVPLTGISLTAALPSTTPLSHTRAGSSDGKTPRALPRSMPSGYIREYARTKPLLSATTVPGGRAT